MTTKGEGPRPVDVRRWRQEILDLLADLPRQHSALEYAMQAFGEDFELTALKRALKPTAEIGAYSQVQALERALTRVQNMLADLAIAGAKLGGLKPATGSRGGPAEQGFEALREAGVVDASVASRLRDNQRIRNLIEHDYENVSAGRLHAAVVDVHGLTFEFLRPFRAWIEPYLEGRA